MQNNSRISCSECKFYFSLGNGDGQCRRMPPVYVPEETHAIFPMVNDLLYCGEFVRSAGTLQIEDTFDDDLEDYYDDEDSEQADLFDDFDNDPVDEETPKPWSKDNPYEDWENSDSAIDALSLSVATLEDTSIDLETDVDSLKDFREYAMMKIEKLEKELQIMKQPRERIGW